MLSKEASSSLSPFCIMGFYSKELGWLGKEQGVSEHRISSVLKKTDSPFWNFEQKLFVSSFFPPPSFLLPLSFSLFHLHRFSWPTFIVQQDQRRVLCRVSYRDPQQVQNVVRWRPCVCLPTLHSPLSTLNPPLFRFLFSFVLGLTTDNPTPSLSHKTNTKAPLFLCQAKSSSIPSRSTTGSH